MFTHKKYNSNIIVSIIIPAYNEEKNISQCIQSILNQTFRNFEIIVVDDGSTDRTKSIAKKYNVKLLSQKHCGPGLAKNRGVKIARGKILLFIDADIYLEKNYIKNIIKPIQEKKSHASYTTAEYVLNTSNFWAKCWNINLNLPLDQRISHQDPSLGLAFRAIDKIKFIELGGFDPNWGYEDDKSLLKPKKYFAFPVTNAICYHKNPDSLLDVFLSARWIGRSKGFRLNLNNLIKYSIINSIRNSLTKIITGTSFFYLFFKIVFDFGITIGLLTKNNINYYSK